MNMVKRPLDKYIDKVAGQEAAEIKYKSEFQSNIRDDSFKARIVLKSIHL